MKTCPNCSCQLEDNATFCVNCGAQFASQQPFQQTPPQQQYAPPYTPPVADPYDHTAEFDPKDISDNKVFAMICYILGIFGIVIALLASRSSEYTMFHVRQALKINVTTILMTICSVILCWTFLVPIAAAIMGVVFFVIQIICFFQVASGKAKEPAIIRSLKFLK